MEVIAQSPGLANPKGFVPTDAHYRHPVADGVYLAVDPVRPPRNSVPTVSEGRRWLLAKRAAEHTYLWHAKHGRRMPTARGW
ncbi:MAG: hypothetical protein ACYDB7_14960 [Mycobacteriales bacterium]